MTLVDRSGSCANITLIVGDVCYVANVGDSRAVLSSSGGKKVTSLSKDHKPCDIDEYKRITGAGGQVYQTTTSQKKQDSEEYEYTVGPIRVLPGRLSVCRTIGDPDAKLEARGGNSKVVTATPDIRKFKISGEHDFIVLGCDGIFDKMSNDDVCKSVWLTCDTLKEQTKEQTSIHQYCGIGAESVLKNSLYRQSLDNVTVVLIAFQNFQKLLTQDDPTSDQEELSGH